MEAVPRMPMLSFELKLSPEFVEFGPTLKQYIRDHYGEDPAHYNKSCNELEQLRQSAVHVSHDFMGCSILKKYYAQLQFLQGRFPMTDLGEASMPFTWEDVHSGREVTHNDIKFEQACILYNIGSLHSLLGALDTRQSADGMKVSCTHFQCAAWAYEYLRDHYPSSSMSLDMSHELLTFQSNLMLAQAQECILEKSMADSRKSTITAKVASQIVEFYATALKSLTVCNSEELISSKQFKDWKKKIDIKTLFYQCITNYYMGQQSQDQQKWGLCLAYYTLSLNKLEECEKLAKNEASDVQESLRFTHDVVGGKHQSAKKDNEFVYHDLIPGLDTLPEVKGAALVKGIPFNPDDKEISGPDIFLKLVPMSAHEASSLYSEEKANLLRRIASEIAEKDEELNKYLSSLQLDQTELNPEPERLPQQLLEKCAAISVRPNAIKDLVDSMTSVSNVAIEVDLGIKEIQQMLQDESAAELEYQESFGKRAPNIILSEIAKECAKFDEGHRKGSQSNTDLHKAMNTHINNLKLLSSPLDDIQKLLPSVDKERGPESADVIKELNKLMNKVEEMREQRQTVEQTLRKEILEDDITGTLAKQEGANREALFAEQLKKHEKNCTLLRQNLAAQGNILRALTDSNAKYASVRRATRDTIVKRDQMIRDLINSYDIYEDLMAKSQKGLEFYKKLEANVQKLLSRCRGVCKVQQEEREQVMSRYKPKAQAPTRPVANKPPVVSSVGQDTGLSSLNIENVPSVAPMFDGPKLKDYLPFMKPNTFGKKAGSPDLSKADPAVQSYFIKTGSLPNSGTASPVHLPSTPGSVPASPDHFRQSKFSPQLQGLNEGHPSLQDVQDGLVQGHQQGQSQGQTGLPPQNQMPFDPRMGNSSLRRPTQSPSPRQFTQYCGPGSQGVDQSQFRNAATGNTDSYVPLDEKWKRESQLKGQGGPLPSQGQGQFQNQLGQRLDPGMVHGYTGSQGFSPETGKPQVPASQSQQPGFMSDTSVSQYQPNMQQHSSQPSPNTGYAKHPQQPSVGYREITNTVSTIATPVIFPNKDGQAQIDQYGQVIGGHKHLQGAAQIMQNVASTDPSRLTAGQVPGQQSAQATANEQYWQQQMQLQQNRLSQSQRSYPHQMPPASQQVMTSQSSHPGTSFQGQPGHPQGQNYVQGQIQNLPGQGQQNYDGHGQSFNQQGQQISSGQGQQTPVLQGQQNRSGSVQAYNMQNSNIHGQFQNQPGQGQYSQGQMHPVQGQGQVLHNQGQAIQSSMQPNQPVPAAINQTSLPANQQQLGPHQGPLAQQNLTSGQATPLPMQTGTSGFNQNQQVDMHSQQPGLNQVPYSQPGSQQALPYQTMSQASFSTHQPSAQTQQPNQSNVPQQFSSQHPYGSQTPTGYGQQGVQNQAANFQHSYQSQPQQPSAFQHGVHSQIGQQMQAQQIPHTQMAQQSQQVSNIQSQVHGNQFPQQNQSMFHSVPTNQGRPGPSDSPHLTQLGSSGSPQSMQPGSMHQSPLRMQPPHSVSQTPGYQSSNMNQVAQQSGVQPHQPLQSYSPQHRLAQSQIPISGVYSSQTNTQQPLPSQQQALQPAQTNQVPQQFVQYQPPQQGQQFQGQIAGSQGQTGQSFTTAGQGQSSGMQGQHVMPQLPGQLHPSQTPQQIPQPSGQGYQQKQVHQSQPFHSNSPQGQNPRGHLTQGQGQSGQRFAAPLNQYQPVSTSGGQIILPAGQLQGQRVPAVQNLTQSQNQSGYIQGQGHIQGHTQGQTQGNRLDQQQYHGGVQPMQSQQGFPAHGQLQSSNTFQGQTFHGQTTYTQNQQLQPSGNVMTTKGQGQHIQQTTQGHQTPLQPQILQPTHVNEPKGQDQNQGRLQDAGQGQPSIDATESPAVTSIQPSYPEPQSSVVGQSGIVQRGQVEPSREIKAPIDKGQSEHRPIPASRQISTASSLDEILSSSPDTRDRVDLVLAPKVLTAQEIQQQKEDQLKNSSVGVPSKDPYKDRTKLDKFVIEVEKFAKFVDGYQKPSCSGPTPLDSVFKELMEEQDKAGRKQTLAIARCYPMKNRDQDIMPFDDSRVLISSLKDDYINASWINDVSPSCPKFIATQWPLQVTLIDFWLTIYEQGVEVIAALSSETETGKKFPVYLPEVKGETIAHGPVRLTLQSVKQKQFWTERIIHLRHSETKTGRTLVHLHYNRWPVSGYPEKVSHLLQFITEVHSFYRQQRSLLKPIVVHCSNGVGRTGIFLLIYTGMMEINHGQGIINMPEVAGKMLWKRRNLLHKKDQLKYCYDALLYYAQDVLAKEGILIHKASFGDQLPKPGVKSQSWEPGEDILFGSISFSNLQTNIAKLGTRTDSTKLDQRLEMLKNGEKAETTVDLSGNDLKSKSGTILPDLVQSSPGRSVEMNSDTAKTIEKEADKKSDITNPLDELFDDMDIKLEITDTWSPLSLHGNADLNSGSSSSLPAHSICDSSLSPQLSRKIDGTVSSSLTELQDPNTFTIGTPEKKKKKKITKEDFLGDKKRENITDPDDPLSSLDPFWTVKK